MSSYRDILIELCGRVLGFLHARIPAYSESGIAWRFAHLATT